MVLPSGHCQYLKTFLVVVREEEGVLLASSGWKLEILLNMLLYTGQNFITVTGPKMSVVSVLRGPGLNQKSVIWESESRDSRWKKKNEGRAQRTMVLWQALRTVSPDRN